MVELDTESILPVKVWASSGLGAAWGIGIAVWLIGALASWAKHKEVKLHRQESAASLDAVPSETPHHPASGGAGARVKKATANNAKNILFIFVRLILIGAQKSLPFKSEDVPPSLALWRDPAKSGKCATMRPFLYTWPNRIGQYAAFCGMRNEEGLSLVDYPAEHRKNIEEIFAIYHEAGSFQGIQGFSPGRFL
jgi:hypothetical protein